MPNQITHLWVGEEVLKRLDKSLAEIAKENLQSYRMGTLGPDFLFVLREVGIGNAPRYANLMQYLNMYEVFEECAKFLENKSNDNKLAYMLGLMCHYVVDMRFHAYVNYFVEEAMPKYFEGKYHLTLHALMEAAIDEHIIEDKMKINPRAYKVAKYFKTSSYDKENISELYHKVINDVMDCHVSKANLKMALRLTKIFFNFTTDTKGYKKKFFNYIEDKKGMKKQLSSTIRPPIKYKEFDYLNDNHLKWRLARNRDIWLDKSVDELLDICIDESLDYIDKFIKRLKHSVLLSREDFIINYEGVAID